MDGKEKNDYDFEIGKEKNDIRFYKTRHLMKACFERRGIFHIVTGRHRQTDRFFHFGKINDLIWSCVCHIFGLQNNRSSHRRFSIKKVALKTSRNSLENTCARVSF